MKVTVLDDYMGLAAQFADWNRLGCEVDFVREHIADPEVLARRLQGVPIVATMRERTLFTARLLSLLPELELLAATGPPRSQAFVDLPEATRLGIAVAHTGESRIGSMAPAELTWGLILAAVRNIPQEDSMIRRGVWQTKVGMGLAGKTLGVIGLGRLGTQVAQIGQAFGMRTIAWGPTLTPERAATVNVEFVDLQTVFRTADVISVHVRLSPLTEGLVDRVLLHLMKPTAYLVNTARGPIIREADLVEVLKEQRIAGAGLDVYCQEPLPMDHPFLGLPNLVMTPHLGYVVEESMKQRLQGSLENIEAYIGGRPVPLVNPEALTVPRRRAVSGPRITP